MITVDACVWVALLDKSDVLHEASVEFWRNVAESQTGIYAPSLVLVEVGCAIARRTQDMEKGRQVVALMRKIPLLELVESDLSLLSRAAVLGTQHFLRAADAIYFAVAQQTRTSLVTWDQELIMRADAIKPTVWHKR